MYEDIIVFDPSGNFTKDKGTTGVALFLNRKLHDFYDISANNYDTAEDYWDHHLKVLDILKTVLDEFTVVCESFLLRPGSAKALNGSEMETSQLIGAMRMYCYSKNIPFVFQPPSIKDRFTDEILLELGLIEKKGRKHLCMGRETNLHMRDAIRHGVYYLKYGKEKNE